MVPEGWRHATSDVWFIGKAAVNGGQKARKSGARQKVGTKLAIASAAFRRSTING